MEIMLRMLVEMVTEAALVALTANDTISVCNQRFADMVGVPCPELIGVAFRRFLTSDGARELSALRDTDGGEGEMVLVSGQNSRLSVQYRAKPTELGGVLIMAIALMPGFAGTQINSSSSTSQQKLRALLESERRLRAFLESAPDAIVIMNQSGEIVLINSQTERLFGYSREELAGSSIEILLPERFRHAHQGHRQNYFRLPKVRPMGAGLELLGLRKDGTEFPVEISLSPIEQEDGGLVISSIRDASERKQFERALREKNVELENASLAKDRFLSSMSHELRTPLNAIIGFTGTMLMRLPGPLAPDQEKQLKTIQTSGKHLLSLINDLLDLAKIESGKVEVKREEIACLEVIEEVINALRPMAKAKSLELNAVLCEEPVTLKTDQRALSQILINLINNAIKFTDHGSIRLEVGERVDKGNSMAVIQVVDTGIGIKPEDQTRLFQAFEQVHSSRRGEGTGLGLHLSNKLAALIGGRIEFESVYGQGSCFTVLVPKI